MTNLFSTVGVGGVVDGCRVERKSGVSRRCVFCRDVVG